MACAPSVEPVLRSDNTTPLPAPRVPARAVVEVRVEPPAPAGAFQWEAETTGLVTALLETGLADLRDVIPAVEGAPPALAFDGHVRAGAARWTAGLALGADPAALAVQLHLCDDQGACTDLEAVGTRESPFEAVAALLADLAAHLRLRTDPGTRERQARPLSPDRYAVLLCGRAAATWYGRLPPVPPEHTGDRGKDPVARSVYLDPGMHLAWWVVARQAEGQGDLATALVAMDRALVIDPDRVPYLAERAALLTRLGEPDEALATWTDVATRLRRGDLRFQLAHARTALDAGRAAMASELVAGLPAPYSDDPGVVALEADVARHGGREDEELVLLARWQALAPEAPEPVERRVALLLARAQRRQAWELLPELAARGRAAQAAALQVPLGLDVGAFDQALTSAEALGLPAVVARIEARRDLTADPAAEVRSLAGATDAVGILARGEARLARGEASGALEDARALLAADPWLPEALALEARALGAQGNESGRSTALDQLALADPEGTYLLVTGRQRPVNGGSPAGAGSGEAPDAGGSSSGGGPSTAPGSTGSTKQAQSTGP